MTTELHRHLTTLTARRQSEAHQLIELYRSVTAHEPALHHPGIVGFGTYDYEYDSGRSGRSGCLRAVGP